MTERNWGIHAAGLADFDAEGDRGAAMITIRPPEKAADWEQIRRICCETAYGGAGLPERSRWDFFGQMWVGAYERLAPEWSLVVRDDDRIIGYLNGCPESVSFERRKRILHDWPLAVRVMAGEFPSNQDTRSFLRRCLGLEKSPNRRFSSKAQQELREHFPAHLHMNLTHGYRGQGIGLMLLEEYSKRLRKKAVPGLHVHCGQAPLGFYQKAGLAVLERQQLADNKSIFILTKSFRCGSPASR